jgi:hypothetical protein
MSPKKRPVPLLTTGPAKLLLLRQPGYPSDLGSVAFRPTIARGLALSVMSVLVLANILGEQFQCQKGLDAKTN